MYKIVDITTSQDRVSLKSTPEYYLVVEKPKKKWHKPVSSVSETTNQTDLKTFLPIPEPEKFRIPHHFKVPTVGKEVFVGDIDFRYGIQVLHDIQVISW